MSVRWGLHQTKGRMDKKHQIGLFRKVFLTLNTKYQVRNVGRKGGIRREDDPG